MIDTLEEFLEDQCGIVTPKLIELFEPHREFIEDILTQYDENLQTWSDFTDSLWLYLPDPKNHFTSS